LLSGCTQTDKEQEVAAATLGSEGSSAGVRLGGVGSGDSMRRTDTAVPVLGGGRGGQGEELTGDATTGATRRHARRLRQAWRRPSRIAEMAVAVLRMEAWRRGISAWRLGGDGLAVARRLGSGRLYRPVAPSDGSGGVGQHRSRLRDDDSKRQGEGRRCGGSDSVAPLVAQERWRCAAPKLGATELGVEVAGWRLQRAPA
jgi:hypothetical protein